MCSASEAIRRELRDLQSFAPWLRRLKFAAYNRGTRHAGLFVEPEFKLLARMAPCALVVDVGGNWGQSVFALRRYARPARIVTFEPNPELARMLQRTMAGLHEVRIENVALGDEAGDLVLHVPRYRRFIYDGLASLDRASATEWLEAGRLARFSRELLEVDTFTVRTVRLDDYGLAPDVVKIDVQGFETAVARGGMATLYRSRPVLIVEAPTADFVELAAAAGLHPYRWSGKALIADDLGGNNTLFLSPERKAALGF